MNLDALTFAVPNNGCDFGVVYQMPEFGREDVGDDQMGAFAALHCFHTGKDRIQCGLNIVRLTSGTFLRLS